MGHPGRMSKSPLQIALLFAGLLVSGCTEDAPAPDAQVLTRGQPEPVPLSGAFTGLVTIDAPCEGGAVTLIVHAAGGAPLYLRRYELDDPDWHDQGRSCARYFALTEADRERQAPAEAEGPFELEAIYDPLGLAQPPAGARRARAAVLPGERNLVLSVPGALSERTR